MKEGPRIERIDVARAQMNQAQAELAKAEWRLDNCIIRAPISGTILKKNAEEGSLVNPIAMQGFYSLCEMAEFVRLGSGFDDPGRDIARSSRTRNAKCGPRPFPDRVYEGTVSRLMPTADRAKGRSPSA